MSAAESPRLAEHFANLETQSRAARFGMWIFLATEILLFSGLFIGYGIYRTLFTAAFHEASRHLDKTLGTIETGVLLTSSLCAVLALHFARLERRRWTVLLILLTALGGILFLGIHAREYLDEFREGALPGPYYRLEAVNAYGAPLFFSLYFMMTGLHGIHVSVGVGLLIWVAVMAHRRSFEAGWVTPLELVALYWHLVDVFWIFIYPLLYLVG